MSRFVLDTSIALKWFLVDETDRAFSLAVLQIVSEQVRPVVPWLWYYEIANTLLIQVLRKRLVFDEVEVFLSLVAEMPIDIDPPDRLSILGLPHLARKYGLTGYDAAFLELALRLQIPLASGDKQLVRAAAERGVRLLTVQP